MWNILPSGTRKPARPVCAFLKARMLLTTVRYCSQRRHHADSVKERDSVPNWETIAGRKASRGGQGHSHPGSRDRNDPKSGRARWENDPNSGLASLITQQSCWDSFSAVSKTTCVSEYSFCSMFSKSTVAAIGRKKASKVHQTTRRQTQGRPKINAQKIPKITTFFFAWAFLSYFWVPPEYADLPENDPPPKKTHYVFSFSFFRMNAWKNSNKKTDVFQLFLGHLDSIWPKITANLVCFYTLPLSIFACILLYSILFRIVC